MNMATQQKSMQVSQALLPEIDHEKEATRKHLERMPEGKLNWKPHQKSMTMGQLAMHIAGIPGWADVSINKEEMSMTGPFKYEAVKSAKEALEIFDKNFAGMRKIIAETDDETFMKPWTMIHDGKKVMTMPRVAVVRGFMLSHLYHHRAQLGVYLRLNDIPVPSTYGPSADEGSM
jgi:uncharacterized damage-inducible protein DinB